MKHSPSCPPCHGPPTLSPSFHIFSESGTAATVPMTSCPGTIGKPLPKPACWTAASEWLEGTGSVQSAIVDQGQKKEKKKRTGIPDSYCIDAY